MSYREWARLFSLSDAYRKSESEMTGGRSTKSHESTRNQTNTNTVRDISCDFVDRSFWLRLRLASPQRLRGVIEQLSHQAAKPIRNLLKKKDGLTCCREHRGYAKRTL